MPLGDTYANGCQLRNRVPKFLFNSSMGCGWLVDDIDVQPMSRRDADTSEPTQPQESPPATSAWQRAIELAKRLRGQDKEGRECA